MRAQDYTLDAYTAEVYQRHLDYGQVIAAEFHLDESGKPIPQRGVSIYATGDHALSGAIRHAHARACGELLYQHNGTVIGMCMMEWGTGHSHHDALPTMMQHYTVQG